MVVSPLSLSASMTRWKPSVSSCVSSAAAFAGSLSVVACVIGRVLSLRSFRPSVQKIAVLLDMGGEIECVLAVEALGELGVAPLQRLDDLHVIGDRAGRAVR